MKTDIQLDMKTRATREGDEWVTQRLQPDGTYKETGRWHGNRRSLFQWCDDNNVHPSRHAAEKLALLPEQTAFAPDRPR